MQLLEFNEIYTPWTLFGWSPQTIWHSQLARTLQEQEGGMLLGAACLKRDQCIAWGCRARYLDNSSVGGSTGGRGGLNVDAYELLLAMRASALLGGSSTAAEGVVLVWTITCWVKLFALVTGLLCLFGRAALIMGTGTLTVMIRLYSSARSKRHISSHRFCVRWPVGQDQHDSTEARIAGPYTQSSYSNKWVMFVSAMIRVCLQIMQLCWYKILQLLATLHCIHFH